MKEWLISLAVAICMLLVGVFAHADLIDCGESGELFYDNETGLYWYDPRAFSGWSMDEIAAFVKEHQQWNLADLDRIQELGSSMDNRDIERLPGMIGSGAYYPGSSCLWTGFIDPKDTYVAAGLGGDSGEADIRLYTTLGDDTGSGEAAPVPVISGTILHGAWLYSESDPVDYTAPVPEPSTIFLIGTGLIGIAGVMRKIGRKYVGIGARGGGQGLNE